MPSVDRQWDRGPAARDDLYRATRVPSVLLTNPMLALIASYFVILTADPRFERRVNLMQWK
jgi:hypothetical protein